MNGKQITNRPLQTILLAIGLAGLAQTTNAQNVSHQFVNTERSSAVTHIFVSQSIEGEFGEFELNSSSASIGHSGGKDTAKWQGYNLTQTFGLELFKFLQFSASHSMMNMRSQSSSLQHLGGSRFSGGARLVFLAPVANLEAGAGVIGSRYDYQNQLNTANFYGSGVYYSLGFNYFMNERVSVFGQGKMINEHAVRNGGNSSTTSISAKTTNLGMGFTLWL